MLIKTDSFLYRVALRIPKCIGYLMAVRIGTDMDSFVRFTLRKPKGQTMRYTLRETVKYTIRDTAQKLLNAVCETCDKLWSKLEAW